MEFQHEYAESLVKMWRVSKQNALGIAEIHSFQDQLNFLNDSLTKDNTICLALDHQDNVLGFMATDGAYLNQLYVHVDHQRRGIGSELLSRAKQLSNGSLKLYTFEMNTTAQQFYESHGFRIIGGGSDNEEKLPDLLFEWKV